MDSSTLGLIITLLVALLILRWVISPIPQSVPEEFNIPDPARQSINEGTAPRQRRQVTESMIEVVQAIAPHISKTEISRSLVATGSVEATIEALLEAEHSTASFGEATNPESSPLGDDPQHPSTSLVDRYMVDVTEASSRGLDRQWGKNENERESILQQRKAEMILRARSNIKDAHAAQI